MGAGKTRKAAVVAEAERGKVKPSTATKKKPTRKAAGKPKE